jgi:hypothetical protein
LDIAPDRAIEPIQEKEFEYRTTKQMQTPQEWAPSLDENINNIQELEKPAQEAVQYLKALHEEKNKIDTELEEAKKIASIFELSIEDIFFADELSKMA